MIDGIDVLECVQFTGKTNHIQYRKKKSFTFELYFSNEFLWIILAIIFKAQYYFPRNLFIIFKSPESIFEKKPEITIGTA